MKNNLKALNKNQDFLDAVIANKEPETTIFYENYDRLVWDIASKWQKSIVTLSKGQVDIEDIHSEVWAYIFQNVHKCDITRSGISSWVYIVTESKLGMMKRNLEAHKNNVLRNETYFSFDSSIKSSKSNNEFELTMSNLISDACSTEDTIEFQEILLDFVYTILELVDSCTEKERKIYLLKIMGKSQTEIAFEAKVSKSYIPKVYKLLTSKFKKLYKTLDEQEFINKKERNGIAKDLLSRRSNDYICKKYDLESDTVSICKIMLDIAGVVDA